MLVKGIKAIAEMFEVSDRTVRNWRDQGAPISKNYEADPGILHLWKAKKKRGGGGDARQTFLTPQRGKEFEEIRFKRLQADKLQREADVATGELVSWKLAWAHHCVWVSTLMNNLRSWSSALPPLLEMKPAREITVTLRERVMDLWRLMYFIEVTPNPPQENLPTRDEAIAVLDQLFKSQFGGYRDEQI